MEQATQEVTSSKSIANAPHWPSLFGVAGVTFLLHLLCIGGYGYFRDELYYLECARHFDWGYVDHPPLSVAILKLFTMAMGEALWVVRLPGVLFGCASVVLYGLVAYKLGGNRWAQFLAAVFAGLTPVYAVVSHLYSMNGIDITLWAAAALCWISAKDNRKLWIWVGFFCGLALLNKLSGAWLITGIALATLATPRRTELATLFPWLGLGLTSLIFAPHFIWQQEHGWITQEFVRNAAMNKMVPMPPHILIGLQIVVTNPALSVLWIAGIVLVIKYPQYRGTAIPYLLVLVILFVTQRARENYIAPAYIFVAPIGAIWLSEWLAKSKSRTISYSVVTVLLMVFTLSLALPLLPPPVVIKVAEFSPIKPPPAERGAKNPLQGFGDMFGWPEMATAVEEVWNSLPEEERLRTPIYGQNYGESAAVSFFSRDVEGMKVIGRHNNYWIWGPGDWDGQTLIIIGEIGPNLERDFESIELITRLNHPYAVPEEANAPISIARGLKIPVKDFWQKVRLIQ